jgi:hypothetical protein
LFTNPKLLHHLLLLLYLVASLLGEGRKYTAAHGRAAAMVVWLVVQQLWLTMVHTIYGLKRADG